MKLSIITVSYNNKLGLIKTINSVKCQVYKEYEFIVIDGGSTDGTTAILKQYENLFSYCISEKDKGIYHAMNKGILVAKGEYCLFLNSGDELYETTTLEKVFDVIQNEDIVYGNSLKVKPHYRRIIKYSAQLTLYDFYKREPGLHHQASFIKKEVFDKLGVYSEEYRIIGDWVFFFKAIILNQVSTKYIDLTICKFDATGLSNTLHPASKLAFEGKIQKDNLLSENFPDYILEDYRTLEKFNSHQSILKRLRNKISYFSFRK